MLPDKFRRLPSQVRFILWISLLLAQNAFLFSQITYESSDYADVNDSFIVSHVNLLTLGSFDFDTTGGGITWDYTDLVPVSQEKVKYINPNRTGFQGSYLFTCNSICYNQCYSDCIANGGNPFICTGTCGFSCNTSCLSDWINLYDLAEVSNDSLDLGVLTIRDIYNFYNSTNTGLFQIAIGARVSGFPTIVQYQNPDRVYKFPFTYGSSDSSMSNYGINVDSIPGTGINVAIGYRHGQNRSNEVEGWGTLKTPFGDFDALKMKTIIKTNDTVVAFNDTFTLAEFLPSQIIPDTILEYKWFSKDFGIPLLKVTAWVIDGNYVYQGLEYIDSLRCFDPFAVFGYLPLPAAITTYGDSVEVSFYDITYNADELYWNFNDTNSNNNLATGQNPSHWFTEEGVYNVELVTCNTACPAFICDTMTLPVLIVDFTEPPLGIAPDFDGETFSLSQIFPNPFYEKINILLPEDTEQDIEIQILDVKGVEMKKLSLSPGSEQILTIDLNGLPANMYFIKTKAGNSFSIGKIVKLL